MKVFYNIHQIRLFEKYHKSYNRMTELFAKDVTKGLTEKEEQEYTDIINEVNDLYSIIEKEGLIQSYYSYTHIKIK